MIIFNYKSKKELKERWRNQLKFSSISNYHDLVIEQENALKSDDKSEDFVVLSTLIFVRDKLFIHLSKAPGPPRI